MFDDLKKLFSRAWGDFHAELSRREPEDQVAELLTAMRREMVDARAALPALEDSLARVRQELERERGALADCRRRRELAERIGDGETVRVAEEFAARHARRVEVLEEKLRVEEAERELRREEVERMSREYRKAEANRFAMVARLRAAGAEGRVRGAGGSFDDFDRVSEELDRGAAYAEALDELSDLDSPPPPPRPSADEVEERLRELKRRMGHS